MKPRKRATFTLAATVLLLCSFASFVSPTAIAATPCQVGGKSGGAGVLVYGHCVQTGGGGGGDGGHVGPPTKTIACGGPTSPENAPWNKACGTPSDCFHADPATGRPTGGEPYATLTLVHGQWTKPVVWCPGDTQPAVTMAAVREQAIRLLPHVKIGSAWTTSALVNAETVLWAGTAADRDLGAVTIVGQRVRLRISFDHADWNFGDGHTDTVTTPGEPYDATGDPCRTAQCRDYYGHTYEQTGTMTITLAVAWHAQFSIAGADWTDIDGAITGPADQHVIAVKQARGVLVPNPGDH